MKTRDEKRWDGFGVHIFGKLCANFWERVYIWLAKSAKESVNSSTMGYIRPNLTKMTSQISWLLIGGEHLRKIFGKIFGKGQLLIGC